MTPLDDLLSAQLTPAQSGHLSLVTCVLGASASWFSQSLLSKIITSSSSDTTTIVIHISFIHEAGFHRDCVRKLGVDLAQHTRSGRYCFIDGLSGLLLPPAPSQKGCVTLANGLQALGADIKARIRREAEGKKAYLLVENPDVLLAAGGFSALEVINELLDWHELVHSTTVLVNADSPLVSRTRTKLEVEAASLVTTLAHQASTVTSLRMLDTGLAKDVSGVLRVTRRHDLIPTNDQDWNEKEVLYFVKDGSVEVFGRGEMRT